MPTGDVVSSLCPRSPYGFAPQRPCPARGGQKKGPHARHHNGIIYEGPYSHGHAVGPCQSDAWVGMGGRNKRATCPPPQQHLPMGPTWAAPRCSSTVPSCTRRDASATWSVVACAAALPNPAALAWAGCLFPWWVHQHLLLLPPAACRSCRQPLLPHATPAACRSYCQPLPPLLQLLPLSSSCRWPCPVTCVRAGGALERAIAETATIPVTCVRAGGAQAQASAISAQS